MAIEKIINVILFDTEIGKLGYDIDKRKTIFQFYIFLFFQHLLRLK